MGKKKSTVLMVLLTIVIVALCVLTVFPSMHLTKVYIWNPAAAQYDLGADLGGGFYAYYYPTGVISETEFKALDEDDQETYDQWKKEENGKEIVTGLYLKNDPAYGIIDDAAEDSNENGIVDEFEEEFAAAAEEIAERYAEKGYSDYRVAIVDDFAIRVQIPAAEGTENSAAFDNAHNTFEWFAKTGEMTIMLTGQPVSQLEDNKLTDIIDEFSVDTAQDMAWLKITFSELGDNMISEFLYEVELAERASLTSSASDVKEATLEFMIGDKAVITLDKNTVDYIYTGISGYEVTLPLGKASEKDNVETMAITLNSAMRNAEGFDIEFTAVAPSQVRTYGSVLGEYTLILLYIALFTVIVALIAFSVVKMGRFGVVSGYSTASYLIVTGLCFAFITGGVYEITLGTALVFVLGLALMNALNVYIYNAIKAEFAQGKTVDSSVKGGYKKTLWNTVDIYAVLLLGALALLIGAAGLQTLATQAIICIVTGAFCNLLWTRVINYVFLSASKNKYKYFRFVREDNDDE